MLVNFIEMLAGTVFSVLETLFGFLPQMPFGVSDLDSYMNDSLLVTVLSWMNYFLPLQPAATIVAVWSTAMLAYIGVKLSIKYGSKLA